MLFVCDVYNVSRHLSLYIYQIEENVEDDSLPETLRLLDSFNKSIAVKE